MKHNALLLSLLMSSSLLLTACGQDEDRWSVEIGDEASDNQENDSNTGADSNTDTGTDTGIDAGKDANTGTNSDSNTDTDSGNDTGTDSDGDSNTDSNTDTGTDTDPVNDQSTQTPLAKLASPAPGSEIKTSSFTLTPTDTQANKWLDVGTTLGGEDIFNGTISGATVVSNIPLNGQTLYVTLWSEINGQWEKEQYTLNTSNLDPDTSNGTDTGSNTDNGADTDNNTGTDVDTDSGATSNSYNQAPLAMDNAFVLLAGQTINGQMSADDIEADDLTFEVVNQPQSGAITLNNTTGEFSYSAGNSANNNSDSFSYRVFDGEHYSNTAQITLRYSQHAGTTLQGRGDGIGADLVIIGDGFTQSQMGQFHDAVNDYVDFMFAYEPEFKNHQKAWNIHRVDLISQQSGADNSNGNNKVNTALDGYFNCGDIDRLLCVSSPKTFAAVNQAFPQWDNILVIVNSSKYGGAGYSNGIGTVSLSGAAKDVGLHEMAHSFAGLADEYSYGGSGAPSREPSAANATINNSLDTVKWKHWLGTGSGNGTVGLFEGAQYVPDGVWRPTQNSIMRSLGNAFHAVNKEAWTLAVYEHGGVYHSKQPVNDDITQAQGNDTLFKVNTVMGQGAQSLTWYLNDQAQSALKNQHQVSLGADQNVNFTVRVDISDNTGNIRKDDNGHANDSITWEVSVQ